MNVKRRGTRDEAMIDEMELRRYLLGQLREEQCWTLEAEFMTNEETWQMLLLAEDELVDDYCRGDLAADEHDAFRRRFALSAERRAHVTFASSLRKLLSETDGTALRPAALEVEGRPVRYGWMVHGWRPAAAAAILATLLGGGFLLWPPETSDAPTQHATRVVSLFLATEQIRSLDSESTPSIELPTDATLLELQLALPEEEGAPYEVVVERSNGERLFSREGLRPRSIEGQRIVLAAIPARLLNPGGYRVTLRDPSRPASEAHRYDFQVSGP